MSIWHSVSRTPSSLFQKIMTIGTMNESYAVSSIGTKHDHTMIFAAVDAKPRAVPSFAGSPSAKSATRLEAKTSEVEMNSARYPIVVSMAPKTSFAVGTITQKHMMP